VGLLRGLLLARVLARRLGHEFGSVEFGDLLTCGRDGLVRQCRGVGAHIGDVAVFVQRLSRAHGLAGADAEVESVLLLYGGGSASWCWSAVSKESVLSLVMSPCSYIDCAVRMA